MRPFLGNYSYARNLAVLSAAGFLLAGCAPRPASEPNAETRPAQPEAVSSHAPSDAFQTETNPPGGTTLVQQRDSILRPPSAKTEESTTPTISTEVLIGDHSIALGKGTTNHIERIGDKQYQISQVTTNYTHSDGAHVWEQTVEMHPQ